MANGEFMPVYKMKKRNNWYTTFEVVTKQHSFESNKKEQATGIEPASSAWEAEVLPLNHACIASTL